ncbi:LysR substrate-binding domain-containing protein [Telmatospirillum sp. J64-1]|uniref:LysR substrate-binding domain-containing protein n=1 Tax=Telmatospirillum sp. J64-1 TaxID=2502183 RepID=UPI00115DFD07|nr:LysR substrate-binding domain-containing protein [Telmatospirillum sp. J64-1]
MPLRLPPLSALRLFEAAGRHLSFKRAAEELNITPSAVSHGIVALEQSLGVTLFLREPRKLSLTPEGADYLAYVSEAMALIAVGTERLPSRHNKRAIAISCAPTLASRWLLPLLPVFHEQWPTVSVLVNTSQRLVGFPTDGFDFAIRRSQAASAGASWDRLFGEHLIPVCTPLYRDSLRGEDGLVDLRKATLIHVSTVDEDWPGWLEHTGLTGPEASGKLTFDTLQMACEAAMAGLGIALGHRPLVDQELAASALVEARPEGMRAKAAYWLASSEGAERRPELRAFKRLLLDAARTFDESLPPQ